MDVLSDVLKVIRMDGGGFLTAEFTAPWSIYSPPANELAKLMATQAESIALFHIIEEGECFIWVEGQNPIKLTAGSAIIFPHSPSHNMSSNPSLTPESVVPLLAFPEEREIPEIKHGGKGEVTRLVCGYLQCDRRFNPLIGALPAMIIVTPTEGKVKADSFSEKIPILHTKKGDWLEKTFLHFAEEALKNRSGCTAMLARLSELCYVEVLRQFIELKPAESNNWLSAVDDPEVGRALRLLHADPQRKWTVEELAHAVGRSRSVLADRFSNMVGESPIQYLTNWRMEIAKDLILQGKLSFLQIAEKVGYESKVAFSRAFKRVTGNPPATWRDQFLAQSAKV